MQRQITNTVVMVSPNHFGFNPQTAITNTFQHAADKHNGNVQQKALEEFNNSVDTLRENGIEVLVLASREDVITPDSVFPNNWFSHHNNGTLVVYPMLAANRRAERQREKLQDLLKMHNIPVTKIIDFTKDEENGQILEGTGSLVLEREHKVAFSMKSPRTAKEEFDKWCKTMDYVGVFFRAYDSKGFPIYHTNVTMSIGREYAIVCLDSIKDINEKKLVERKLKKLGKNIITINTEQINSFCGNTLQLQSYDDISKIVMSETAFNAFTKEQKEILKKYGEIIALKIPTIEAVGGGSARCMLAEVFEREK